MIDPTQMTRYNLGIPELEETILFCACVAGKNAITTARAMDRFLSRLRDDHGDHSPFGLISRCGEDMPEIIRSCGIGCFNKRARTFRELAASGLDLRTCGAADLEAIYNIGLKTSRFFILHTREDARVAVLDTHILKHMASLGYVVPKSTPPKKLYVKLESEFLKLADQSGKTVAEYDLELWNHYSNHMSRKAG